MRRERIRDVLQEDQPEHDVLVFRRLDVLPHLVGRLEQVGREGKIALLFAGNCHCAPYVELVLEFMISTQSPIAGTISAKCPP